MSKGFWAMAHEARSARRRHEHPVADPPEHAGTDATDVLFETMLIQEALASLTPEHRAVIVTAYYGGFSVAQTADALDIPEGTVKSRLHAALNRLTEEWEAASTECRLVRE